MLAAVQKDLPQREQSHLNLHTTEQDQPPLDDRLCPGCKKSAVNEQGGLVVAFGQSFFHVDCFKCAKCRNQVTADTNLLLLSDGSPICANCSYSCNICRLPILDEAIMTGDDSYHAHCFKCKVCSNRIDELVFAKTSQGIYCMNCHNERMIKIRKHAQKKAEREKAANGGSGSSRSRDTEARNFHRDQESRSNAQKSLAHSSSYRRDEPRPSEIARSPTKASYDNMPPSYSTKPSDNGASASAFHSQSPPVSVTPPTESDSATAKPLNNHYKSQDGLQMPVKSNTLPIPPPLGTSETKRRGSDAVRPSNLVVGQDNRLLDNGNFSQGPNGSTNPSLSVTSRRDKRRSINPGVSLTSFKDAPGSQSATLSPVNATFSYQDQRSSPSPSPYLTAADNIAFSSGPTPHPRSRSNSVNSLLSPVADGHHEDTIVMTSPPTMAVELDQIPRDSSSNNRYSSNSQRSANLSPTDANGVFHSTRRSSTNSNFDRQRSGTPSRAASPAHHADVPEGIDSGTDTDPENDADRTFNNGRALSPPAPPPKDTKTTQRSPAILHSNGTPDPDISDISPGGDGLDDLVESSTVQQTSHTTFIAPALPPIRFSMNTADFSELLSSVGGGLPPLKSLDNLAKLQKQNDTLPSTPPPTASSFSLPHPLSAESLAPPPANDYEGQQNPIMTLTSSAGSSGGTVVVDQAQEINRSGTLRQTESDSVIGKLREAVTFARDRGARQLQVDLNFADTIVELLESRDASFHQLKSKVDGMNRESKRFIVGLTVAQAEYDQELKARRDAEAEVTRLRVLLSGQAVRLAALSGDNRKQELRQQMSKDLHDNLSGLEHDLSRLKVERDMTLAEVEELSAKKTNGVMEAAPANLSRSLTKRLEGIRSQYQRELLPLTEQKEALCREIAELKSVRDMFLEETTVLNARNEELAQLSAVYARRLETGPETPGKPGVDMTSRTSSDTPRGYQQTALIVPSLSSSTSGSSTVYDDSSESRHMRAPNSQAELQTPAKGKFKWPGSKSREVPSPAASQLEPARKIANVEHNFQQLSVLRFARCDHCGDKMWGSQLRCTACSASIHVRCIAHVQLPCTHNQKNLRDDSDLLPPSMFGRDLGEQVDADSTDVERRVPIIVEKCINAVEERALDYEGIYRKTGGSSQSKAITQLFETGDYDSFDLCDSDRFTDICSITSVLKTYFRTLPTPLLTFDLHDQFISAVTIRDPVIKQKTLTDLVNSLPNEYYFTLRMLMMHLHNVCQHSDTNLMTGRNLGVVFGPTLMRSRDPGAEFSDMAGKALFIEWLVENAPSAFSLSE